MVPFPFPFPFFSLTWGCSGPFTHRSLVAHGLNSHMEKGLAAPSSVALLNPSFPGQDAERVPYSRGHHQATTWVSNLSSLHPGHLLPPGSTSQSRGFRGANGTNLSSSAWIFLASPLFCSRFSTHVSSRPCSRAVLLHTRSFIWQCRHWGPWTDPSCVETRENSDRQTQLCHHPLLLAAISTSLAWALSPYNSAFVHNSILPASELFLLLSSE